MSLRWCPPTLPRAAATVELSNRQADVLTGLCHGLTSAQIGRRLGIPTETVKSRLRVILRAMGAADRVHAVALVCSGQVTVLVRYSRKDSA